MRSRSSPLPRWWLAFATGFGVCATLGLGGWLWREIMLDNEENEVAVTADVIANPAAPDRFVKEGVWAQIAAENQLILHAPTPPPRSPRLALPWEPHEAVIMAVELQQVTSEPRMAQLYRAVLEAVLPVTRVQVMFHRRDRRLVAKWLSQLEAVPALAPQLDKIEFVPSEIDSMWVRDFGPMFGVDRSKRLLIFDTAYIDPRIELSNYLSTEALAAGPEKEAERSRLLGSIERMRGSDIAPSIYAGTLQLERRLPTQLVRPPLVLAGGDILPIGSGHALVSRSTLDANGGRGDFLEAKMRQYFGIETVHYVNPLPGETIEHIDFVVQAIAPDSLLVAAPIDFKDRGRPGPKLLRREFNAHLQANRDYLERAFPKRRIIDVPMPAPLMSSDDEIVQDLFLASARSIARGLGIAPSDAIRAPTTSTGRLSFSVVLLERMEAILGGESLDTREGQTRLIEIVTGQSIATLFNEHFDTYVRYRSYLNSLLVVGAGGERLLVPRFRGRTPEDATNLAVLEKQVEAAYRLARPTAQLVWIDCTDLVQNFGAVHCFLTTLPLPESLGILEAVK